ncbi:hypothetical protein D3C80_1460490 [compost metagenome]
MRAVDLAVETQGIELRCDRHRTLTAQQQWGFQALGRHRRHHRHFHVDRAAGADCLGGGALGIGGRRVEIEKSLARTQQRCALLCNRQRISGGDGGKHQRCAFQRLHQR